MNALHDMIVSIFHPPDKCETDWGTYLYGESIPADDKRVKEAKPTDEPKSSKVSKPIESTEPEHTSVLAQARLLMMVLAKKS